MLRSIQIERLAGNHLEIALRATMPAAQIAAIEANHSGRSHRVNVGICRSLGTLPCDTLADVAGSIAHRTGVDGASQGQQLRKQVGDLRKRRQCGKLGGDIGELWGHAAFKRQRRKASRFIRFFAALAARNPTNSKRHVAEERSK